MLLWVLIVAEAVTMVVSVAVAVSVYVSSTVYSRTLQNPGTLIISFLNEHQDGFKYDKDFC